MAEKELISIAFLIVGSLMLYFGADFLVKGSSRLAFKLGITPLIIGLTVVAFGTSSPELVVSLSAGFDGNSSIALGNVIGSNICNIALILGLAALIKPLEVNIRAVSSDLWIMLIASAVVIIMALDGDLDTLDGIILILGIIGYIVNIIRKSSKNKPEIDIDLTDGGKSIKDKTYFQIFLIVLGLVVLMVGANLFLEGAVNIAESLGVSNAVIGLTVVALGTSLPELATSTVAAVKGESDISLGNVVGSNIFNILMILGATSMFFPIGSKDISVIDIGVMIFLSLVIIPLGMRHNRFSRMDGLFLLAVYAGYMFYLFKYSGTVTG
ncbi:MAG: calcium/sodium antiporter [Candidatus Kapaibacterium sp.]|jgi:cation:H+ antiporter|nr:calcium/sodium antiporter [Candidatus Kapabacteria bacterium]